MSIVVAAVADDTVIIIIAEVDIDELIHGFSELDVLINHHLCCLRVCLCCVDLECEERREKRMVTDKVSSVGWFLIPFFFFFFSH